MRLRPLNASCLSAPRYADCSDLYEFLRAGSQLYELASPQQPPPLRRAPRCAAGMGPSRSLQGRRDGSCMAEC